MDNTKIYINDKEYNVQLAITEEEQEKGLQGCESLDQNAGMLFVYETPQTVQFWMKDCSIPLDLIFIDETWEILGVVQGEPNSEDIMECDDTKYVLELNANSGVKEGDDVDLNMEDEDVELDEEDNDYTPLVVVGPRGKTQVELKGGERIFSRPNTKTLIRIAKRGYKSKQDSDFKALGKKMFQYIKTQDNNEPEYVEIKE